MQIRQFHLATMRRDGGEAHTIHWGFARFSRARAKFEPRPVTQRRELRFELRRLSAMPARNAIQLSALRPKWRQPRARSRQTHPVFERNPFRLKHITAVRTRCDKARANWRHLWGT